MDDRTHLVLGMDIGDDIIINEGIDEIIVTFEGWHGRRIKVGFSGPADIPIDRRKAVVTVGERVVWLFVDRADGFPWDDYRVETVAKSVREI